jgi:rhodanese-related sulfurtransferase
MKTLLFGLILAMGASLSGCAQGQQAGEAPQAQSQQAFASLPPQEWQERQRQAPGVLLDVRTPAEVAQGRIAQSQVIDFQSPDFRARLAQLDKAVPVYVYCASGGRSGQTLEMLRGMGFASVVNLEGGIRAWTRLGLPVVQ